MPVTSANWEAYPWKNELKKQADRAVRHAREVLDPDYDGDHNPNHMLERAIILAAFAVRRMFEKRLVTDALTAMEVDVRTFSARAGSEFRRPFIGQSGGRVFDSYTLDTVVNARMRLNDLANEIIHCSQLMVVGGESWVADGLLIASDWKLDKRLVHLTFDEFMACIELVLNDRVRSASDAWDPETGKVSAKRE